MYLVIANVLGWASALVKVVYSINMVLDENNQVPAFGTVLLNFYGYDALDCEANK